MTTDFPLRPNATIGIVGGGQLGRMIASAAARLGYRTVVLDPQADCPAAQLANRQVVAGYGDAPALEEFAALCDVVTYEFENVPVEAARLLASTVPVSPPPAALAVSQDRLAEKVFLNELGIGTAPFRPVSTVEELAAALDAFGGEGVLKTRRLGYDGKGQHVFRRGAADDPAAVFAALGSADLILEGFIAFEREISVIGARGRDGTVRLYDPAENVHRRGILYTSTVPAKISDAMAEAARKATARLLAGLDYVGVVGLELFVLPDGTLLANEFAPRVHNSGHWTEAVCLVSQFEQHVRAVAGLPLGSTTRHVDCRMENLIGDDVEHASELAAEAGAMLTLYGKAEARPGRKMGHVTRLSGPARPVDAGGGLV